MGRFKMKLALANHVDVILAKSGMLDAAKVRRLEIDGVVDSGATKLVLPTAIADQLGLNRVGKTGVRYADGRRAERDVVDEVDLTLLGRHGVFSASLEPGRETALIGAIVMEELDFLIDCVKGTLHPRDPNTTITEIE
jgi:predicted aspartyl protease